MVTNLVHLMLRSICTLEDLDTDQCGDEMNPTVGIEKGVTSLFSQANLPSLA